MIVYSRVQSTGLVTSQAIVFLCSYKSQVVVFPIVGFYRVLGQGHDINDHRIGSWLAVELHLYFPQET